MVVPSAIFFVIKRFGVADSNNGSWNFDFLLLPHQTKKIRRVKRKQRRKKNNNEDEDKPPPPSPLHHNHHHHQKIMRKQNKNKQKKKKKNQQRANNGLDKICCLNVIGILQKFIAKKSAQRAPGMTI